MGFIGKVPQTTFAHLFNTTFVNSTNAPELQSAWSSGHCPWCYTNAATWWNEEVIVQQPFSADLTDDTQVITDAQLLL